jgi:hypothetical protein
MEESRDIYERLARASEAAAVAAERERNLARRVEELEKEMETIRDLMSRGRGVLLVLMALGSIIGLILGAWDKIFKTGVQ